MPSALNVYGFIGFAAVGTITGLGAFVIRDKNLRDQLDHNFLDKNINQGNFTGCHWTNHDSYTYSCNTFRDAFAIYDAKKNFTQVEIEKEPGPWELPIGFALGICAGTAFVCCNKTERQQISDAPEERIGSKYYSKATHNSPSHFKPVKPLQSYELKTLGEPNLDAERSRHDNIL